MATENEREAIQDLLTFWFAEDTKARWYHATPEFDELCRQRFADQVEQAGRGELAAWQATSDGALALCLLLDQIPRNIFRGSARAFATDPMALDVASRAIDQGFDQQLPLERRLFLYLPFMHSERLVDQERSLALYRQVGDEASLAFAKDHADIVRRFGRFPHRNAILGRQSTEEELAFLATGAKDYGQATTKS